MDPTTARQSLCGFNLVIGCLFLLTPRLALRLYGVNPDRSPEAAFATRYLGARSLMLAFLLGRGKTSGQVALEALPVLAASDAGANIFAAATGEVPKRTVLLAALSSAAGVTLGVLARDE